MSNPMRALFDTEQDVTTPKKYGVPDEQAHGFSEGLKAALNQGVATSEDMTRLEARMTVLEGKIDNAEKNLKIRLFLIAGLVALTSPVAMHIFKAIGIVH
jgi:hypothetical protein